MKPSQDAHALSPETEDSEVLHGKCSLRFSWGQGVLIKPRLALHGDNPE